jgi:glycosyltransferase involved in cell wall biosynthesis
MPGKLPLVSVVMPVYNADTFLEAAVHSVLDQTLGDLELIIVCSDPTERTLSILQKFQGADPRVAVYFLAREGIVPARNFGCRHARGEFIAVMDADDIALPMRLEAEVKYLRDNPAVGIVGSWSDIIDAKGTVVSSTRGTPGPAEIGWNLLFHNCFMHLTIVMRRSVLEKLQYYTPGPEGFSEDYDLWTRAFFVTELALYPAVLAQYRIHPANSSRIFHAGMVRSCNTIRNRMIQKLLGRQFDDFLAATGFSMDSDIFSWDSRRFGYQVQLIDNLYSTFFRTCAVSPADHRNINAFVAGFLFRAALVAPGISRYERARLIGRSASYSPAVALRLLQKHFHLAKRPVAQNRP